MSDPNKLRIVIFGSSIVSDWRNPQAALMRPIIEELVRAGHEVLFFEERNNPWMVGLLKDRGIAPVRAFDSAHPAINHRTYDLPKGRQRGVWFAQLAGTADAIVGLHGTPEAVLEQIDAFRSRSVVRGVDAEYPGIDAEFRIGHLGQPDIDVAFDGAIPAGPIEPDRALHPNNVVWASEAENDPSGQADNLVGAIKRAQAEKLRA